MITLRILYSISDICNVELDATSEWAQIYSPNYPNNYFNDAECYWLLHSVNNTEVELQTFFVDLENGYDVLRIYDGVSENSSAIATLTGVIPYKMTFFSTGTDLFAQFLSDEDTSARGFHFQFRETFDKGVCDSEPCQNGGSCSIIGGFVKCLCPIGTGGTFCEGNSNMKYFVQNMLV